MPLRIETEHNGRREYLAAAPGRLGTVMLDESLFTRDSDGHVHLEPGTVTFTFAIVTLGVMADGADFSRLDDKTYR